MVNHDITYGITAKRIFTVPNQCLSTTETHVTNDYVVRIYLERLTCDNHTITRSCLSSNRNIWCTNIDGRFQTNNTRYVEHNDTCATLFTSPTERTWTIVIEIGNGQHLSATTAKGKHTPTLCTRESRYLCLTQIIRTSSPRHVWPTCLSFFYHYRKRCCPCGITMCLPTYFQ